MEQLLAQLRDIHLPATVHWWPLAWGWWVLLALTLAGLGCFFVWRWWYRRRVNTAASHALLELQALSRRYEAGDEASLITAQLSVLLRRVALSYFPRHQVAALVGDAWLQWLDDCVGERLFFNGAGAMLNAAPYQPHATVDVHALFMLSHRWLSLVHAAAKKSC